MSSILNLTGRRLPLTGLALVIGLLVGISLYAGPSSTAEAATGQQRWHEWMMDSLRYSGSYSSPATVPGEYQWVAPMPEEYVKVYKPLQDRWYHWPGLKTKTRDIEPDSVIPRLPSDLTKESDSEDTFEGSSYTGNSGSFTGAVAWLVRGDKMLQTLGSLESLALYMPMNNRYKFLFMHEGDLGSPVYQQDVKDQWNVRIGQIEEENPGLAAKMTAMAEDIEFILVDLHAPNEIAQLARAGELKDAVYGNRFPGYQNMCRFFAYDIFWDHHIRKYDYYMRMDVDSYILTPMPQDPFQLMHDRGLVYGYRATEMEQMHYILNFGPLVGEYAKEHGDADMEKRIRDADIPTVPGTAFPLYYNNFEIVHTASFRTAKVAAFLEHLRSKVKMFYQYRWGDACIRYATVNMFFKPEQTHRFQDWGYHHWEWTYEKDSNQPWMRPPPPPEKAEEKSDVS